MAWASGLWTRHLCRLVYRNGVYGLLCSYAYMPSVTHPLSDDGLLVGQPARVVGADLGAMGHVAWKQQQRSRQVV